ncbi:MAG: HYR domain-containing protein [Saprospiraceae bacterium]|nr:HYR domain-containing protein [Saprospiraceae bacterium]
MRIQHFLSCLCLLLIGVAHIQAQTQYIGPDNGDWFTAANWNNGLPAAGNNALVGGGVTVLVGSPLTVDFGITAFGNITATAPVTVAAGGSIANSASFVFNAGSSLTNNATVQNFGTMTLVTGANFTNETGASFTNSGPLTVSSTLTNRGSFTNNGTIDALNGTVQTQGSFNNNQVLNTKSLTVSTGSSFTNDFGSVLAITGASASLQVDGSFTNNGTVNASGLMTVNGSFANNVTLNVATGTVLTINASAQLNNGGTLENSGFLQNYGTFTNGNTLVNKGETNNFNTFNNNNLIDNRTGGSFFNRAGGTLGMGFGSRISNAGSFTNQASINSFGTIENNGTYTNSGTILSFGGSLIDNNSTFNNSGTISTNDVATNDGTFTNSGTLNVNGGSVWSNFANFTNAVGGTVNVVQDFNNKTTGVLVNNGKFVNTVRTRNEGSFTNNAFLFNPGDITNAAGGTLTNNELFFLQAGNLLNAGTLVNTDKTLVDECSSVSNTGSINNTGGNLEQHGLLFQRGTLSGNAINNQGGYTHTAPTSAAPAVCKNGTFGANIDGDVKVYAGSLVSFENFDSCANIIYLANGIDRPVFNCTNVGTVLNLNLVVRTRLGDSLTCVAQVTPVDLLEPQISGCPKDQIIFTPNSTATATWTAPTATDNCSSTVNVTSTHTPGASFPIGITGVSYTFTDAAGNPNQCQFRIDVRQTPAGSNCTGDTAGPTFTGCPANISTPRLANLTPVAWSVPTPNDNCKPINLTSTHIPGTAFPVGTTTVTYTAKDGNNNSSTCSFTVTITAQNPCTNDTQKPTFSGCPSNIFLPTNTAINGAVAFWNAPGAGDNCGIVSFTASHAPGSVFPVGTTTVTYSAADAAENTASCSFTITVGIDPCPGDAAGPSISGCPSNISLLTNGTSATATWTAPTATDACTPITLNNNYAPGSTFPLGTTQVAYQFSDKKGNTSTCSFTVTVQNACSVDNVNPVITGCPASISLPAGVGGTAVATWTAPTVTDNCGLAAFTSSYLPGASFPTGTTTVVYSALDLKGNAATCQFNVTVFAAPTCTTNSLPIADATNVTPGSVSLAWASAPGAASYDVYFGTSNPPTATVATNVTSNATTVTNLLGSTDYYFYVVPKNAAGSATGCAATATTKFTTAAIACTASCTDNTLTNSCFENGLTGYTGTSASVTSPGATGNFAVALTGATGKLEITRPAVAGSTYTFRASSRISNTSHCGTMFMRFKNAAGTVLGTAVQASVTTTNFTVYTLTGVAPVGTTQVTISAEKCANAGTLTTDEWCLIGANNSALAITCPANITMNSSLGSNGTVVTYTAATATSTCTVGSVTVTRTSGLASGSTFPVGTSQVCYSATDGCGNTQNCCFNVTVNSAIGITCPANVTVSAVPGATGAVATYSTPTTSTNCATGTVTLNRTSGLASGATFPIGTTQVCHTATNGCGATANCCFNVVVNSTASTLAITCPATINASAPTGATGVAVTFPNPTATTNCTTGSITYAQTFGTPSGSTFPIGTTQVCFSATDGCFTTQSCCFNIVVTAGGTETVCKGAAGTGLTRQVWNNITGTSVSNLTSNAAYPNSPSSTSLNASSVGPANIADNYGTRVRGFITPSTTGSYTFYVYGDDETQLFLSTTSQPANKVMVANVSGWTNVGELTKYPSQTSTAITLTAGQDYYVELLQKEGGGGDHWGILWKAPGSTSKVQIPLSRLSPIIACPTCDNVTSAGTIAGDQTFCASGNPVAFTSTAAASGGTGTLSYIWERTTSDPASNPNSWVVISGATGTTYDQGSLTQTTWFRRGARRSNCTAFVYSNTLRVTINSNMPTASCQSITRQLTAAGQSVQIAGTDVNNGSTAGCGATITSYNVSPTSFSAPGTYTVTLTVTNSLGLSSTCTSTVTILAPPCTVTGAVCEANVDDAGWQTLSNCGITVCTGDKLILSVNPNGLANYQWSGPNSFTAPNHPGGDALVSNSITSAQAGTYTVTMTDASGCTATKSITVTVNNCNACTGNMLVNAGFESGGTDGWTWTQNASTTTSSPNAGTRSLQICNSSGGVSQYMPALSGVGYTLKVNAKIIGATGSVGLRFYDKNWVELSVPSAAVTATTYTQYTVTATAPYAAAYMEAWASKNTNGCLYADEFCLTSTVGFPACSNNVLGSLNPGFESSFTNWDWVNRATITTTDVFAGTRAAQVCTSTVGGGAGNQTTAIPGATYSLQLRAKISGSPSWAGASITFYDANWNVIGQDASRGITATSWSLYLVQAVAPINAAHVGFSFWKDAGGCLYVDDFCATATGGGSSVCDPDVLFVVGSTNLNSGDTWVKNRLQALGLNVTVKSATAAASADATGKGLVVISTTINSADVTSKFTNVTVPIVTWESYILDDLKMTGATAQTDYGENNTYSSLVINNASHPLSAGLSGTVRVLTAGNWIRWGATNNAAAIKAASVAGQSSWWGVLGYDKNAAMQGGFIAPARRVSLFLNDDTPTLLTENGKKLFDAAIEWAIGCNLNNVDGNTQVSNRNGNDLEMAETAEKTASDVQVFPNPASDRLYLEFSAGGNDETTIRLFDINGRAVQEWEVGGSGEPIELQLNNMASGQYLLWISEKGQQPISKRIVVADRP